MRPAGSLQLSIERKVISKQNISPCLETRQQNFIHLLCCNFWKEFILLIIEQFQTNWNYWEMGRNRLISIVPSLKTLTFNLMHLIPDILLWFFSHTFDQNVNNFVYLQMNEWISLLFKIIGVFLNIPEANFSSVINKTLN